METVIGEAIGLLGSVEGRFGFSDRLRSSWCWAMSWAHSGRLSLPLKNKNSASGQYGRVAGSGKRRDETRGAPSRSHRMIASEGGAAGFCMAFL